jgi:NTE family protein
METGALFEHLSQKFFISGEVVDAMNYNSFSFDIQININPFNSFIGVGLNYEYTKITPTIDPEISDNMIDLRRSSSIFNNIELYTYYVYNSMNSVFYPTKGNYFKGSFTRSFLSEIDLKFIEEDVEDSIKGKTNGYTKLNIEFEKRIPFDNNIAGIIGANTNFIFEDRKKTDKIYFSKYGYT